MFCSFYPWFWFYVTQLKASPTQTQSNYPAQSQRMQEIFWNNQMSKPMQLFARMSVWPDAQKTYNLTSIRHLSYRIYAN